ncbi:hypothetical protein LAL4801_06135 [Roseibium aggregatum]|uniref:Uncharacterized protein n=1 Tax=Roseibium aggregatum TaxID=187304 RepID=A0A0M6YDU2_9HYPH|nr:hypothetical protein LAL4801_06135 [Roseibium aggregatum]
MLHCLCVTLGPVSPNCSDGHLFVQTCCGARQPNEVSPDFGVTYQSEGIVQCNGFVARHEVREGLRIFDGDRQIVGARSTF